VISILVSAALKLYIDQDAIARFLRRNARNGILISTGVAVGTPFCSCGTTAVVLGMLASTIPWAPIVAFIVSSPLTSPEGLFYSAGIFGWPFAIAFFISSILLGLAGGAIASFAEARGWLANQARMASSKPSSLSLGIMGGPAPIALPVATVPAAETSQCGCSSNRVELPVLAQPKVEPAKPAVTFSAFVQEVYNISKAYCRSSSVHICRVLLNGWIPAAWIGLFGTGHVQYSSRCNPGAFLYQYGGLPASSSCHARKRDESGRGARLPDHRRRHIHGGTGRDADDRSLARHRDSDWNTLAWFDPSGLPLQLFRALIFKSQR
jgi:uncharacterized membrane protein YraQ (UPF0718 family)